MPCLVARRDPEPPLSPPRLLPCSLLSLALLAACGGGGASGGSVAAPASVPPVTGSTRPVTQSDLEIAELAYTDATRVPVGFRIEPARYTGNYATLAHLRSTDLDPATARPYEVCTNDFATALAWSESVATARPVYGDLVENNATPLYHEFVRRLRTTPARDAIDRVYRCDYVDRSDVDLRLASGSAPPRGYWWLGVAITRSMPSGNTSGSSPSASTGSAAISASCRATTRRSDG